MLLDFLTQHSDLVISLAIFAATFIAIIFDIFDKSVVAMAGAALLLVLGVLDFEHAVGYVDFEIIALLAAMMIIVEIAQESGFFTMLNFKLAKYSKGNPFLIFLFFTLITALGSAFLDNVTTILIVVPITVALVKGLGYNPFIFVIAEIMFSNIGGSLTLIGDPPNVLVGTAVGFSFNEFILTLAIPTFISMGLVLLVFYLVRWDQLKPIHHHLPKLFTSNVLLKKVEYQHRKKRFNKRFIFKVLLILGLTVLGFLLQSFLQLPIAVIAITGAFALMLFVHKRIHVEHVFSTIEWATLGFFAGLFVIVGALEHSGILELMAQWVVGATDNFNLLILLILWGSGLLSTMVNNIPFVTVMIPILFTVTSHYTGNPHADILWWALIMGSALGGNGTMIGASANVIGVDLARKQGVNITFLSYLRYSLPITFLVLCVSSVYLLIWANYF